MLMTNCAVRVRCSPAESLAGAAYARYAVNIAVFELDAGERLRSTA
jgi:hypothetical protein